MAIVILMDLLIVGSITSVVFPKGDVTKKCSEDLYNVGMVICLYNVFFVIRNLVICGISYITKNPVTNSTISRLGCICLDCIAFTFVVIWATTILVQPEVSQCKDVNEDIEQFYWVVVAMVVFGYIMIFAEFLICLVSTCVFCFFLCFYFAQAREQRAGALAQF